MEQKKKRNKQIAIWTFSYPAKLNNILFKLDHMAHSIYTLFIAMQIVPRTELVGDADRYVKAGSTVILRCIIRGAIEPPSYIIWYHGSHQLLPDNKQGIRIEMAKSTGPNTVGALSISDGTLNEAESTERQTIVSEICWASNRMPTRSDSSSIIYCVHFRSVPCSSIRPRSVTRATTLAAHQTAHHQR